MRRIYNDFKEISQFFSCLTFDVKSYHYLEVAAVIGQFALTNLEISVIATENPSRQVQGISSWFQW